MALEKLSRAIQCVGWTGKNRFVPQVPLYIRTQFRGGSVSPCRLLFNGMANDPVQVLPDYSQQRSGFRAALLGNSGSLRTEAGEAGSGARRFFFADDPQHFKDRHLPELLGIVG